MCHGGDESIKQVFKTGASAYSRPLLQQEPPPVVMMMSMMGHEIHFFLNKILLGSS